MIHHFSPRYNSSEMLESVCQMILKWKQTTPTCCVIITVLLPNGETVETVSDFIFGVSKITVDGDCSHEIKRRLLLGRKVMTNLDSILKSRDITLSTKVHLVKAMVFPVVMYRCESWTVWMWELDCEESWAPKNWCFWTAVLEKTLSWESLGLQGDPTSPS